MLWLHFENGDGSLSVRRFSVSEGLNEMFEVRVFARSPNDDLDLESFVGKTAGFALSADSILFGLDPTAAIPRAWSGVCTSLEQTEVEPGGLSTYLIKIAPRLWLTTQRTGNRIFEQMTIPEIAQKLLAEYRIEPELRLREPHGKHEYRVQFGETDWAFLSRLLEEEGISFWFEQVGDATESHSKLVLGDAPDKAEPLPLPVPFVDNPSHAPGKSCVTNLHVRQRIRPGAFSIRDFDHTRPDFKLDGKAEKAKGLEGELEQYRYEPAAYVKDLDGKPRVVAEKEANHRADVALQAIRASRREVTFDTNRYDLTPGKVLKILGHPRSDVALKDLLVVELDIEGRHDGEWTQSVVCAFASLPFAPPQKTPKPVMRGVQSAIVVGKEGEEIHTDEHGRVRVQFHWDREHGYDERSSCWVRVSQGWAGSAFGFVTLPRVGQEVVVDFLDGDPDQPIVVGRVYNQRTKAPFKLPEHRTKSTWKSNSTPKSDGWNEILFEDKLGSELVYVQAERDLGKLVRRNENEQTGVNRAMIVGANRTAVVGANDSVLVGAVHTLAMASLGDLGIGKLAEPNAAPKPTFVETKDKSVALTTGKVSSLIEDDRISVLANADVVVQSGGTIVIDGAHVYVNSKSVGGKAPSSGAKAGDDAGKPQGRVLDAVKKAFGLKKGPPEAANERKELDVPHRVQVGPTCGIAALGMVLDYWKAKDAKQLAPTADEILQKAKDKGWTQTGGMWERDEAKLAQEFGYDATYKAGATVADLKKAIDEGKPALITFSVDQVGEPQNGTDRGHYAVIKGYFEKDGKKYLVASHGWSSAKTKVWEESQFEQSWGAYGGKKMVVVSPKG